MKITPFMKGEGRCFSTSVALSLKSVPRKSKDNDDWACASMKNSEHKSGRSHNFSALHRAGVKAIYVS